MLRTFVGLLILGLLVLPAVGQDKKKPAADVDKDKDETKVVNESKKKLVASGKIVGKLTQVEGTTKFLTLEVTTKIQKPNLQAMQTMASLQAQIAQASQRREVSRVVELQRQLAQQQPYKLEDYRHKIELRATDEMKVRMFTLPIEYDDKGKPRKYTAKELNELKGTDPKLPGYTAEYENLRPGQEVEVTFLRPKTVAKPKTKDKDRDLVVEEDRLKATLIVILRDAPAK